MKRKAANREDGVLYGKKNLPHGRIPEEEKIKEETRSRTTFTL